MRSIVGKIYQRVNLLTLSLILAASGMSAAVPLILSQTVSADTAATIVTETNLNGWSSSAPYASTNSGATVGLVSDSTPGTLGNGALKITTNSLTAAKGQFVRGFSPIALSTVNGALGYSTKQNSASFSAGNASYQLQAYLNGTSGYTTLTYEPYVSEGNGAVENGVWQTWDVTNGRFYSSRTVAGIDGGVQGSQGAPTYSLAQIKAMFPSAIIYSYGVNVGSNNPSYDVEVDNFTFNGETYDFESTPVVTAQDFAAWDSSLSFKAINVGFKTDNFSRIDAVKVTLQKNGLDIVSNTASAAMLSAINAQTRGFPQNGQLSTPFIVSGTLVDTYCAGGPCWIAGSHNWLHSEKPDSAVITVTENGTEYTATNTNLSEATATFDSLIAPDTTPPTITNPIITNNALWGSTYNIFNLPNHLSEITHLPVIGGTVQVGADFNDDMLLTNVVALLPGRDFFVKDSNWAGVPEGLHTVTWNTKASTWQGVPDGNYTFTFNASDGGNGQNQPQNSAIREIPVTVDNTGPTVAFTGSTPSENQLVKGTITVAGNFTDANGLMNTDIGIHNDGRSGEGWKCHTDWPTQGVKTCAIDTTELNDGTYQLTMAGKDKAGNVTQVFRTIIVDNTAPSVNFVDPTPGNESYVNGAITGQVTATDDVGMGSYYIRVWKNAFESGTANLVKECSSAPGGNLLGTSRNVTCNIPTTLPDGRYVFSAQFLDSSSNWGTAFRTFYVDNTAPTATIDSIAPKSSYSGSANINVHAIDDNYLRTDIYREGETSPKTYTDVYFGLSWLGDGNYSMDVIDKAGNSTEYTFTIDKTAPVVTIDTSANTANNKPTITGKINDPTATVSLDIDGTPFVVHNNGDGTWVYTVTTALADGTHSLKATGTDTAGNTTTPVATGSILVNTAVTVVGTGTTTPSPIVVTPQAVDNTVGAPAVLGAQTVADNADTAQTPAADVLGTPDVKGASTQLASTTTPSSSSTGLAWYWWVLIVAAVVSFVWWLIARLRNRANVA